MEKGRQAQGYHTAAVNFAQFNPNDNGKTFATGSDDYHVKIWQFSDGTLLNDLSKGHDQPVYALAYNKEGTHLVSGGLDKRILLWDLNHPEKPLKKPKFRPHNFSVESIVFSPDYNHLVTTSRDLSWKLWSFSTSSIEEIYKIPHAHFSYVVSAAFSPNGDKLITGSFDKEIRLWKVENGERLSIFEQKPSDEKKKKKSAGSHDKSIVRVAWSSKNMIASIDVDGIVKMWSEEGEELNSFLAQQGGNHLEFSKDATKLITTGEDGVHIWDTNDYSKINSFSADGLNIKIATFSPDGDKIVFGDESGRIFLVDL